MLEFLGMYCDTRCGFILFFTLLIVTQMGLPAYGQENPLEKVTFQSGTVKLDNMQLQVQIAQTEEQQTRGLMFQNELPFDQGMLFVFDNEQIVGIWMMNMQFPLDIIWFDKQGEIVFIQKNAPPCKLSGSSVCPVMTPDNGRLTKYVLEVTSGFVNKFNITKNSKLDLSSLKVLSQSSNESQNQTVVSSVPEFPSGMFTMVLSLISMMILSGYLKTKFKKSLT